MNETILVIEDDPDLREYIYETLSDHRYTVHASGKGSEGLRLAKHTHPSLFILDLGLPDIDGQALCERLKEEFPEIPIIILTAKTGPENVAKGLYSGADDYVTKPFSSEELLARIKARLRHNSTKNNIMQINDLVLNTNTYEVTRADKKINLTQTEFKLLHFLISNKNRVLTREMILSHVWSYDPDIESRVVDVYIGYLRKKVDSGFNKRLIQSTRGFGYSIKE
jgi:DNA-binding response OmpR family regulator